jgi:cyclic nucleotide gated channel
VQATPPQQGRLANNAGRRGRRHRRGLPWRLGLGGLGAAWALDPRARWVRDWNRAYLLACAAGLMVDPFFLYTVSVSGPLMCLFLDGWLAAAVTALRCAVDAMHVWNVATQLRLWRAAARNKRAVDGGSPGDEEQQAAAAEEEEDEEEGAEAARKLPADARSKKALMLDFFVILPVMQVHNLFMLTSQRYLYLFFF